MSKKNPQPQPSPALEEPASSTDLVSRRAKLEDERMSRRQALRKMGILSGVAVLALVSVDDLARLAAKQLAAHSGDSEVAGSVAKSLKSAGVAFADPNDPIDPGSNSFSLTDCRERCLLAAANFMEVDASARGATTPVGSVSGGLKTGQVAGLITYCKSNYPTVSGGNWSPYLNCLVSGLDVATQGHYEPSLGKFLNCCYGYCDAGTDNSQNSSCAGILGWSPDPGEIPGHMYI